MLLVYTGGRTRPFTMKCPSENRYPVDPAVSLVIDATPEDAEWMMSVEVPVFRPATPEDGPVANATVTEAAPAEAQDANKPTSKNKKKAAEEDGKV